MATTMNNGQLANYDPKAQRAAVSAVASSSLRQIMEQLETLLQIGESFAADNAASKNEIEMLKNEIESLKNELAALKPADANAAD